MSKGYNKMMFFQQICFKIAELSIAQNNMPYVTIMYEYIVHIFQYNNIVL